jgi:RimJ/RimL family protein N-acetyltransferase
MASGTESDKGSGAGSGMGPAKHTDGVPPVFETSRLRLRPWRDTDGPGPGEGPDADSLRFMPAGAQPGPDDFPAWLAQRRRDMDTGGELHWCVADRATDAVTSDGATSNSMLGNVQIFRMGPAEGRFQGELGYWLRPGARGRRIVGEAIEAVAAHAFRPVADGGLGLVRLHAATDSDNYASQSILRSAGFRQCGADHKAWRRTDGSLSDGQYFELLADEPDPAKDSLAGGLARGPAVSQMGSQAASRAPGFEPVTLEGKGIRLRKWRHTDADRIVEACSDERTRHWLADSLPSPYTVEHAHSYIAGLSEQARNRRALGWCVADSQSDVCLGAISVMNLRDALGTAGEIGYWTHPDARGRGVMSEAVRLAVRHAFIPPEDGGLGRIRLRLNAADGNLASQQIARANGFVEVGRDRLAEPLGDGTFADLVRFDLLIAEWNAAAAEHS